MESETQRDGGFATTGFSVIRTRGCAIYSASKADAGDGCMRVCVCVSICSFMITTSVFTVTY